MTTTPPPSAQPPSAPPVGHPERALFFIVMALATNGIYLIYWAYKNFEALEVPDKSKRHHIFYSLFLMLSFFPLTKKLQKRATAAGYQGDIHAKRLSVILFVAGVIGQSTFFIKDHDKDLANLLGGLSFAAMFAVCLWVQLLINKINRVVCPTARGLGPISNNKRKLMLILVSVQIAFSAWNAWVEVNEEGTGAQHNSQPNMHPSGL